MKDEYQISEYFSNAYGDAPAWIKVRDRNWVGKREICGRKSTVKRRTR
jgi:hypothetical protein